MQYYLKWNYKTPRLWCFFVIIELIEGDCMEKKLSSKTVFSNDFLTLNVDQVKLQDGRETSRVYVKHVGAASCLPLTKEGLIILTKQYRYPIGMESIEIPAGKRDDDQEDYLECIKRELEEETGYSSSDFSHLMKIHNCVGYSDEIIEIFVARNCEKVENPIQSDEDEFIEPFLVTKEEALQMIKSNEITDVKTIIAIQSLFLGLTE